MMIIIEINLKIIKITKTIKATKKEVNLLYIVKFIILFNKLNKEV